MPAVKTKRKLNADVTFTPGEKLLDFCRQNPFPAMAARKSKKITAERTFKITVSPGNSPI